MIRFEPARAFGLAILGFLAIEFPSVGSSHSASDAYLTLTTTTAKADGGYYVIHGQWDIALRDLDFVLKLDEDGDGRVTWGEVREHRMAIAEYAYRYIQANGRKTDRCSIKPKSQMIDDHADGAYAALFFDVVCAHAPRRIKLQYTLFFNIDPSHRGIFVMNRGTDIATALLSPENTTIELDLSP